MNNMASHRMAGCIRSLNPNRLFSRKLATPSQSPISQSSPVPLPSSSATDVSSASPPQGYYKITLLRSAISLGDRKKGTLKSLGIHRRMQTVYHPHSPEFAGKILAVKELVKVENVGKDAVRTKTEQRRERRPARGFKVVGQLNERDLERICE